MYLPYDCLQEQFCHFKLNFIMFGMFFMFYIFIHIFKLKLIPTQIPKYFLYIFIHIYIYNQRPGLGALKVTPGPIEGASHPGSIFSTTSTGNYHFQSHLDRKLQFSIPTRLKMLIFRGNESTFLISSRRHMFLAEITE